MQQSVLPTAEIIRFIDDFKIHRKNDLLIDRLTVIRGYTELAELHPESLLYRGKLYQSLSRLSDLAQQQGLTSIFERLRNLGIPEPFGGPAVPPETGFRAHRATP